MEKVPSYLNAGCLKKALEKALTIECVNLKVCEIKRISVDGENFCSDIYRANLAYNCPNNTKTNEKETMRLSLIVKDMKLDGSELDSSEAYMYETVLPQMEQILTQRTGECVKLKPNAYLIDRVDKLMYVLEDMNVIGYKLADRCIGLDYVHARLVMKKLAKFHAASMIYMEKHPNVASSLCDPYYSENPDPITDALVFGSIRYTSELVQQWPHFQSIAQKMRRDMKHFNERVNKCRNVKESSFNVISHGDFWSNNMLFSYQQGVPNDVVLLDFQNCFVGSPGCDLNHFLNTSLQLEVLQTKRYELLHHYYAILSRTLKKCHVQHVPTWQMLADEVLRLEYFGYYAAVCEFPFCCMSPETSKGFTSQMYTNLEFMTEKRKLMYGNERVQQTLRYSLDRFNEMGVLN